MLYTIRHLELESHLMYFEVGHICSLHVVAPNIHTVPGHLYHEVAVRYLIQFL